MNLPPHLQKYIVEQNFENYSALDHAVWRYVLRQLRNFLGEHAHESYLEGLKKTGIDIEQIPRISDISEHLEKFGWRALPVSGFIPPAAFMELQSLGILPIASDMRSIDHLLYTPAPDIVHEAAGHAPIISDPEYAAYLKQYAQVAKKAIISREDLEVYKAIRELSDIKENPHSTPEEIKLSEEKLATVTRSVTSVSEASELARMNWWTAEYGLVGPLASPKIFGAGLLSSVGESRWCLSERVKKIPLSLECIKVSYDITEPQPQLFVARDFAHLAEVLEQFSNTMAYRTGGISALERARKAESINTVEFENGLQISGVLKNVLLDAEGAPCYLQFAGPTQLSQEQTEIAGQGASYHSQGYGTPVGEILNFKLTDLKAGPLELNYKSGVRVSGELVQIHQRANNAMILTFKNATASLGADKLFQPEWGMYDIVLARQVVSVWGGPADREAFGEVGDFVASRVVVAQPSSARLAVFEHYKKVRELRQSQANSEAINALFLKFCEVAPQEWLLFLELHEMAMKLGGAQSLAAQIEKHLSTCEQKSLIAEGLKLSHAKY